MLAEAVPCSEEEEMPCRGCVIAVGRDVEQLPGLSGMAEGKVPPGMDRSGCSGLWLQHSLAGMAPGLSWPCNRDTAVGPDPIARATSFC